MTKRKIINIDENKCNGCGICIPNCPEGALKVIDGKARLVHDLFCDGLGACIGHCPRDAITIQERDAEEYDENKVMANIVKAGKNTIIEHLNHLKDHGLTKYRDQALEFLNEKNIDINCPGSAIRQTSNSNSALKQWPVQLHLLPVKAPFFDNAHLLVCADCVPFAFADFHSKLLHGKSLLIGCPKLDDIEEYAEKLKQIVNENKIKSITVAIMEVPCCYSLYAAVEDAAKELNIPIIKKVISVGGLMQ